MSKIYVFKHYPPTPPPPPFLGPGRFALNSHTYYPVFEKILDPPLAPPGSFVNILQVCFSCWAWLVRVFCGMFNSLQVQKWRMDSTLNWSYINHGELHCQDCSLSNDNLVITFELALINSLATVLLLPLTVQARPWFRFSMWTSSVARLALFLVAFTRATIVVLCRGENGKPFCLPELWPCTNTCIVCIDRSDSLRFLQSRHPCVASKNIERNFILVPHTSLKNHFCSTEGQTF